MLGTCGLGSAQNLDTFYNTNATIAANFGPIGQAVAIGFQIAKALKIGYGCGVTCLQAANDANSIEPTFRANVDGYESGQIDQATAVANYNGLWTALQGACGQISGDAGKHCISDRQAGACKWKQTGEPQYPGQPAKGECWNWDLAYHQPLLLPAVNATTSGVATTGVVSSLSSVASTLTSNPLLLVGAGLLIYGVMSSGSKN